MSEPEETDLCEFKLPWDVHIVVLGGSAVGKSSLVSWYVLLDVAN